MAKADSVLSTPPTNTSAIDHPMMFPPRDPTRRRFLITAAGASAMSVGSLAASTIQIPVWPIAQPCLAAPSVSVTPSELVGLSMPDPVFGLIEAHRKAGCDHEASLVVQARLEQIGDNAAAWVVSEAPCHAEFNAFDELLSAAATTVPGIVAQLAYLQEIAEHDGWRFSDREDAATMLLEGFAASIANILR
jgi:hypothetical protein